MKAILVLLAGTVLASVCVADSAAPYGTNLLAKADNLDIRPGSWTLADGILTEKDPVYQGVQFLAVKEGVVKVPVWYSLGCDLVNPRKLSGRPPVCGLLFGFVDDRNYWRLTLGSELALPVLELVQVKDGQTVTRTYCPATMAADQKTLRISMEIHHGLYVKAYANKSLLLTHEVTDGIARGRVGITLQSGICEFSNFSIAGIAKH